MEKIQKLYYRRKTQLIQLSAAEQRMLTRLRLAAVQVI